MAQDFRIGGLRLDCTVCGSFVPAHRSPVPLNFAVEQDGIAVNYVLIEWHNHKSKLMNSGSHPQHQVN